MSRLQRSMIVTRAIGSREAAKAAAEAHGYRWSLSYLKSVMEDLGRLEERALAENDKEFLREVRASMNNARQAEHEVRAKLD